MHLEFGYNDNSIPIKLSTGITGNVTIEVGDHRFSSPVVIHRDNIDKIIKFLEKVKIKYKIKEKN